MLEQIKTKEDFKSLLVKTLKEIAADRTIISLSPLITQAGSDLKEVSANGTGSFKETRTQELSYINANAQISESQVTNLISDLASKLNLSGGTMTGELVISLALSGITPALFLNSAQGSYINFGLDGRNLGVQNGGNFF